MSGILKTFLCGCVRYTNGGRHYCPEAERLISKARRTRTARGDAKVRREYDRHFAIPDASSPFVAALQREQPEGDQAEGA